MRYFVGALVILLAAWFGLKNTVYNKMLTRGAPVSPAPIDHMLAEGWASQPDETPPGAWETPWGVDIFVVYPAPRLNAPHGLIDADEAIAHPSYAKLEAEIRSALPEDAAIYVPKYRMPSNAAAAEINPNAPSAEDLRGALEAYLDNTNRGRGILLVAVGDTAQHLGPVLARLSSEGVSMRFAGLVHFTSQDNSDQVKVFTDILCSPALEGDCYQSVMLDATRPLSDTLLPRLANIRGEYAVLDPKGTATAISAQQSQVSNWLDTNAPKPAEPLFGFEAIEAAPIFRPNGEAVPPAQPEQ